MIIDIDIKIADGQGNLLQRLVKRFDNIDVSDDQLNFSLDVGRSFEEFLSEYMSYSGRRIQEKLFTGSRPEAIDEEYPSAGFNLDQYQDNVLQSSTDGYKKYEDRDIQYLIRIGNGNVFSGKLSMKQPLPINNAQDNGELKPLNSREPGCEDLNYLMQKAIEKYETTFYHVVLDEENAAAEPQPE